VKQLAYIAAATLSLSAGTAVAQSSDNTSVRVAPGHFCALNKCVRFSNDLTSVSIQGRRPVSVAEYGLRNNPVISSSAYRNIFSLALRQGGINGNRG
jgi:hypothetical protein